MKVKQLSKTKLKISPEELAKQFIQNRGYHYAKIVEETQNYWKGFYDDCFKAAEQECLKSGNFSD